MKPWEKGAHETGKYRNVFIEAGYSQVNIDAKLEPYSDGYFDPYYDGLLYLFSMMHLSGNYRIITPGMKYSGGRRFLISVLMRTRLNRDTPLRARKAWQPCPFAKARLPVPVFTGIKGYVSLCSRLCLLFAVGFNQRT